MHFLNNRIGVQSLEGNPVLFFIMTFSAVLPLYVESIRVISGLIFVLILVILSLKAFLSVSYKITKDEKNWLYVAAAYAVFFILNYFLHTPYSKDGEWRNAAPVFILLFAYWYLLSIRLNLQKKIINYVALASIVTAIALFFVEIVEFESLSGYRFGMVSDGSRGLAAMGFILPITSVLLAILWLQNRSWLYFVLMLIGLLLSGLNESRTAFFMVLFPILSTILYLFIWDTKQSKKIKILLLSSLVLLLSSVGYLVKDKITATFSDFTKMQQGQYNTSMGLRAAMLETGLVVLNENWLKGVGPSAYKSVIKEAVATTEHSEEVKTFISGVMQIHNQYLMTLILSGVLGGLTLILFLFYPIRVFLKSFRSEKKVEPLMAIGLVLGIAFVMFFGAIFTYTYTSIFYMMAISSLVSFFTQKSEESCDTCNLS